jgi:hypothetical protein
MIAWREKFVAFGIHFLATLVLAAIAAALIFFVWYPAPFTQMLGGQKLFLLVVGIDLALGPLMSLVVYDSRKARRLLILDYSVIGVIQIAALLYGVSNMADARPVYVAFSVDRFEIVQAGSLTPDELAAARDPQFASRPLLGPRFVSIVVPPEDREDALMVALAGKDTHLRPRFYVPFEKGLPEIQARARKLDELAAKFPGAKAEIEEARRSAGIPEEFLRWLPVQHAKGFWTAVIDSRTGFPVSYIDLDPYDDAR